MLSRVLSAVLVCCLLPWPALSGPVQDLTASLRFPELFRVLSQEGIRFGESLEEDLFPGEGGASWQRDVERIHEAGAMQAQAEAELERLLQGQDAEVAQMLAFFSAAPGARITALELAAREAYLDDHVKEVAEQAWRNYGVDLPARVMLLEQLVETSDLVEQNVAGGMNANLAFYKGLRAGGGFGESVPEEDMMADLWSQEDAVREETVSWLMPYLSMAYRPLSDEELQAYVAFSGSPAGQRLNQALFAAFDQVFVGLSHSLGAAAARRMVGSDI